MFRLHRRYYHWFRYFPRRKHLKGGWLHRVLGEGLFHHELWVPTRHGTAVGLAVGTFIALTPTPGVQFLFAAVAAYMLRVNLPIALAACLITNPLSAPFIYAFEYKVGVWMVGVPPREEVEYYGRFLTAVFRHGKPLWIGSLVVSTVAGLVGYLLVVLLWRAPEKKPPPPMIEDMRAD